ncbi:hypothetical protein PAV_141p00470 (plasmid) [Paenibacillus alvei DSM 29]|uniref:hypothetical protein n=1 Tax=Paenibacillus alvei TaxID=44250 RepID=UPI00028824B7|nr:hypothetical protein [Paenibacillus alvei]EJW13941.1 hypothetical protein PAV_141p00470 [Paenibacillus alvei DSM 29]
MEHFLFFFVTNLSVFFLLFCVFQLDEKYADGTLRAILADWWIGYLILNIIPIVNLIVCLLSIVLFVITAIIYQIDERNLTGDDIFKKSSS